MHSVLLLALLSGSLAPVFALPTPPLPTVNGPIVDTIDLNQPTNPLNEAKFTDEVKAIGFSVTGGPINIKRDDPVDPKLITHIGTTVVEEDPAVTTSSDVVGRPKHASHTPHFKPDAMNLPRNEKRINGVSFIESPSVLLHLNDAALTFYNEVVRRNTIAAASLNRRGGESDTKDLGSVSSDFDSPQPGVDAVATLLPGEDAVGQEDNLSSLLSRRSADADIRSLLPNPNQAAANVENVAESGLDAAGLPESKINEIGLAEGDAIRETFVPGRAGDDDKVTEPAAAAVPQRSRTGEEEHHAVLGLLKRDGVFGRSARLGVEGFVPKAEKLADTVVLTSLPGENIHARV